MRIEVMLVLFNHRFSSNRVNLISEGTFAYLERKRCGPHSYLLYGRWSRKLFTSIVKCASLLHKVQEPLYALPSPRMRTVCLVSPLDKT